MHFVTLKRTDGSEIHLNPDAICSIYRPVNVNITTITLTNGTIINDIVETPQVIKDAIEWIK